MGDNTVPEIAYKGYSENDVVDLKCIRLLDLLNACRCQHCTQMLEQALLHKPQQFDVQAIISDE